ncbi:hypothetical protein [Hymenobacter sp. B1770]|uniref:hypothetical protein n=1 Tax=Hymenobacter sp. B1770 TaxID=1718788 RepID=UPI003CF6A2E7
MIILVKEQKDCTHTLQPMLLRTSISLLLLYIIGCWLPVAAQSRASYSKADTVRAMRDLFEERRGSASTLTTIGGITTGLGAGAMLLGFMASDNLGGAILLVNAIGLAAVGVPMLVVGKSRQKEVMPEQEEAVIGAYEQGNPLPRELSRRLRRRHFAVP